MTENIFKLIQNNQNFKNSLYLIIDNLRKMNKLDLDETIFNLITNIIFAINTEYNLDEDQIILDKKLTTKIFEKLKKIILKIDKKSQSEITKLLIDQFIKTVSKEKVKDDKIAFKLNQKDKKRIEKEVFKKLKKALKYDREDEKHFVGFIKDPRKINKKIEKKGFSK